MSRDVFEPISRKVSEPTFPLLCCLVFRLCERPCLVSRGRFSPVSATDVVGPDSARSIVVQSRSVVRFCGILSILAFSLHA